MIDMFLNTYLICILRMRLSFDISKIRLVTLDIEVKSENGFPDPESADQELLLISVQDYNTKQIITWGVNPFVNKQKNVKYIECGTEHQLLSLLLNIGMLIYLI